MWQMFSCLTVNAQLPYFNDKMLLESRKALFVLQTCVSDGDSGTYNHLGCGKVTWKSDHIAQFPVGGLLWALQSASLRRHARCPLASSVLVHANVHSWNIFIITKLIRGCGWLTPHIWLHGIGETWPPCQGRGFDSHIPGLFGYPRASTRTHRVLVFMRYFSLKRWMNRLWGLYLFLPLSFTGGENYNFLQKDEYPHPVPIPSVDPHPGTWRF